MGNSYGPIFSDLLVVNRYYGCDGKGKTKRGLMVTCTVSAMSAMSLEKCARVEEKAQCRNRGFPNPNNCLQCVCPNGFGGVLCEARASGEGGAPPDCGSSVRALDVYQTLKGDVEADIDGQDRQAVCHFHIAAPRGRRIEIAVDSLNGSCSPDCLFGAVEIKYDDLTRGGAR